MYLQYGFDEDVSEVLPGRNFYIPVSLKNLEIESAENL